MRSIPGFALCLLLSSTAGAASSSVRGESPRLGAVELKIGGYRPLVDNEAALGGATPFRDVYGSGMMLMGELELDKELWQGFGTFGIGLSVAYAEKYAPTQVTGTGANGNERTGFFVVPIRAMAIYRLDYGAFKLGIPLVPYVKAGIHYVPWWSTKGGRVISIDGARSQGAKWGYGFTAGLSFLLDVLDPGLARDFDTDLGVNHTYLFAEFTYANVDNFGRGGMTLSSRHFMFGLMFEF